VADVRQWLAEQGLEQYAEAFVANAIDGDVLRTLTGEDLKELGVSALGHRKRLLEAIAALGREAAPAYSPPSGQTRTASAGVAERRQLTVLFCDLVGSTELSARLDPEDLRDVIRTYQNRCAEVVTRWGGHVAKYMGDGVLAYFGWPQAHEDEAERAVRAGLELVHRVAALAGGGQALGARIGIATGMVVVGDLIGEGAAQEEAVVGETPNLAARLQALAEPGSIVISRRTRGLVGGLFELADLGPQRLKGFAEPIPAWRVVSSSAAESRFEAMHTAGLTPLVGREHELGILLERWARAKDGDGQVVLIEGEAGIGKSRLLRALREELGGEPHVTLRHFCSPYHTNSALYPIITQLERAAGLASDDEAGDKLAKLEAMLGQATTRLDEAVPLAAALLGLPTGDRFQPLSLGPHRQKQRTFEVLIEQLAGLARTQPVLELYEDLHWADPSTLELLDVLVERMRSLPVLVVITYRPEFSLSWSGQAHVTALTVNRLGRRQGALLVDRLSGGKALPAKILDQILAKTDGVPLFVEELTKTVLESGLLTLAGDHFELAGPLTPLAIPATLHDSLMARLDRLAPVKEVAQTAATIGREFSHELLAAVSPLPEGQLREALDQLVWSELVFRRGTPPRATYSFKHALVRDAAYQSLLKSPRQQLHARIGLVLEQRFTDTVAHQPELVAHHFTEAGVLDSAVAYWHRAGERASERAANAEAVEHLQKGLKVLADLPEGSQRRQQELLLLTTLGRVLSAAKGYGDPEVATIYSRARALCEEVAEAAKVFPILLGLAIYHAVRAELDTAQSLSERLLDLARQSNDPVFLVEACYSLGITYSWRGDFPRAWQHLEQGMRLYEIGQHRAHLSLYGQDGGPICICRGAMARWYMGYPDHAKALMKKALDVSEALGHPFSRAYVLGRSAILSIHRREITEAYRWVAAAKAFGTEHDFPYWHTQATFLQGWVLAQRGEPELGIERMCQGLAEIRTVGTGVMQVWALGLIGEALGKIGRIGEGLARIVEALQMVDRTGECWFEAELYRLKAELLLASEHDQKAAEASLHRSMEVARHQSAKSWELRAATSLACLWRDQGKRTAAHDLLAPVYDWFTEGFDTVDLKEARTLLDELA
jgi:class 3 adenylate cyclase/predicted ATPase